MAINDTCPALNFSESEFAQSGLLDCTQPSANEVDSDETDLQSSFTVNGNGVPVIAQQKDISKAVAETTSLLSTGSFEQAAQCTNRLDLSTLLGLSDAPAPARETLQPSEMQNLRTEISKKKQAAQNGRVREAIEKTNKKLAQNREHQRRFKMRQKAKAQAVETQLAATTAELNALKLRQQELESMLQHAHISAEQNMHSTIAKAPASAAQHSKASLLIVSINGKRQHLTPEEVCGMPIEAYSALWEDYMHVLTTCLTKLDAKFDVLLEDRLNQLAFEAVRLCTHRLRMTPEAHQMATKDSQASATEQQQAKPDLAALCRMLHLSGDQAADLMRIRQVCLVKRSLIAAEHSAIMADMQQQQLKLDIRNGLPPDKQQPDLAERLEQKHAEDAQVVFRVSRAIFCGVLTMKQSAQVMTFTYGFRPSLEDFLHAFAVELGHPSAEEVIAAVSKEDMDNYWTEFWQYTQLVDPELSAMYHYVPFCKAKRSAHHMKIAMNQNI